MESFKYNVFESESLFSNFTIRGTVFSPIKEQIRSLRMVTVASDFLSMLNGKWSSEKFQDEQFIENSDSDSNTLYLNDYILKETKLLRF
jgi:hypothetical protein